MATRAGPGLLVLGVSLVALGCGRQPTDVDKWVALPESGGNTIMLAQFFGRLAGDSAAGCVWFIAKDGKAYTALWPRGYLALFGPVRVLDDSGNVVGVEGQILNITGGELPAGVGSCRVSPMAIVVGRVEGRVDNFP